MDTATKIATALAMAARNLLWLKVTLTVQNKKFINI